MRFIVRLIIRFEIGLAEEHVQRMNPCEVQVEKMQYE